MLGHTRKHRTKSLYVPWQDTFSRGIKKRTEVGLILKGARVKANLTQLALAKKLGAKPHHISEMAHGKRTIGKAMAHKLAKIFKIDYRVFL